MHPAWFRETLSWYLLFFCNLFLNATILSHGARKSTGTFGNLESIPAIGRWRSQLSKQLLDETTDLLEQALQHISHTLVPAILQRQAEALEKTKDYDFAIKRLQRVMQEHSEQSFAYLLTSQIYRIQGNSREELLTLERAIKAIPSYNTLYPQISTERTRVTGEIHENNMQALNRLSYELLDQIFIQLIFEIEYVVLQLAKDGDSVSMNGQICGTPLTLVSNIQATAQPEEITCLTIIHF